MSTKKVLPPRSTRGQPPKLSVEEQQKGRKIYQRLFKEMQQRPLEPNILQKRNKESQYKQQMSKNLSIYPYSRGYHYFVDLQSLRRVEGSVSYAQDSYNVLQSHFSKDHQMIGGIQREKILNRTLIGLPRLPSRCNRVADKNICHSFLFSNQDKKYRIQQLLYESQYVLKHIQQVISNGKIKQFQYIRKDYELFNILVNKELSVQQKVDALVHKIKILKQRKEQCYSQFQVEDNLFYFSSLNQILHNSAIKLQRSMEADKILYQLVVNQKHIEDISNVIDQMNKNDKIWTLKKVLFYHQTQYTALSDRKIIQLIDQYSDIIFGPRNTSTNNDFKKKIIFPSQLFDFCNQQVFARIQTILSYKMYEMGDAIFYIYRSLWKKLFNREVEFKLPEKPLTKEIYSQKIEKQAAAICSKYSNDKNFFQFPDMQQFIDVFSLRELKSNNFQSQTAKLFKSVNPIILNTKQYIFVNLAHWLYRSIAELQKKGLIASKIDPLLCFDHYYKYHYWFANKIGSPNFVIFEDILKRISEVMPHPGYSIQMQILFQWNPAINIGMLWTEELPTQSDWETQKQEQNNQDSEEQDKGLLPSKKVKKNEQAD